MNNELLSRQGTFRDMDNTNMMSFGLNMRWIN